MKRLLLLILAVSACGSPPAPVSPPLAVPVRSHLSEETAAVLADARRTEPLLEELVAPLAEDRARAALGLARQHDPSAAPGLTRALRDPDASVRDAASLGLAGLGRDTEGAESALLAALASESESPARAHLLMDLGRVGDEAAQSALLAALTADAPAERAAACNGLASYGLDHVTVPPEAIARLAAQTGDDHDRAVRIACAHAVLRLPPTAALADDLARALADADPEVRAMVVRALGRGSDTPLAILTPLLEDPDWDVSLQAFRALASRPEAERPLAAALLALHRRVMESLETPRAIPSLLGALEAFPHTLARTTALSQAAQQLLGASHAGSRDMGQVQCALARLVDLGRGWPSRVEHCGGEQIEDAERERLAAEILGLLDGAERERTAYLARLAVSPEPVVREAVATSLGTLHHPDGRALLAVLATDPDEGVAITAIDSLGRLLGEARTAADAASLAALLGDGATTAEDWPTAETLELLRTAATRFRTSDDLEGLVTVLGAVQAARAAQLGDIPLSLALHHALGVRMAARSALNELDLTPPEGHFAAPPNPITPDALTGPDPITVELSTTRGTIVLELRPDWAPTTVARIAALVRSGFYDGLSFHRVVPAFVAQGGDPRGDGYGGPGWSQRCEDNRIAYERGIVGMALAGRDTGGSQFFIALTPQPHLNGRYTAFARVTEGMENVERLTRGDVILSATVSD